MRREKERELLKIGYFQHTAQVAIPDVPRVVKSQFLFIFLCLLFLIMGLLYFVVLIRGYHHNVQPFLYFEGE